MQRRQRNTLEAARRAQAFLDANASVLRAVVVPSLRTRLDTAVEHLAGCQLEQLLAQGMARGETANQLACRRDLYLGLIRLIGRVADCAFSAPRQRRLLVMSAATVRSADFMKRATRLAAVAEYYKDVFVSQGMPGDFVDRLWAGLAQITTSIAAREDYKRQQAAATAQIKVEARSARGTLGIIDALLRPTLRNDPGLLADWIRHAGRPDEARQ
jgi:hypothetical protein